MRGREIEGERERGKCSMANLESETFEASCIVVGRAGEACSEDNLITSSGIRSAAEKRNSCIRSVTNDASASTEIITIIVIFMTAATATTGTKPQRPAFLPARLLACPAGCLPTYLPTDLRRHIRR